LENNTKLITQIILGFMAVTYALVRIFSLKKKNRDMAQQSRLIEIANIELQARFGMDKIINDTLVDRALIIKVHNGGSKLFVGVSKYISIIEEAHSSKILPVISDFQKFPIDREYMEMIRRLLEDSIYVVNVSTMKESTLKRVYIKDGLKSSILYPLIGSELGFYFVSFSSTSNDFEVLDSSEFSTIEIELNKIKLLYKKAADLKLLH